MPSSSSAQPILSTRPRRAAQSGKKQYSDATLDQYEREERREKKRPRTVATALQVAVPVVAPPPVVDNSDDEPDALDLLDSDKFFRHPKPSRSRVEVIVVSSDESEVVVGEKEKEEKKKVDEAEDKMDVDEEVVGHVVDGILEVEMEEEVGEVVPMTEDEVLVPGDDEDYEVEVGEEVDKLEEDAEEEDDLDDELEDEEEEDEEEVVAPAKKSKTSKNKSKTNKTNIKITSGGTGKKRSKGKGKTEDTIEYEDSPDMVDKSKWGVQRALWISKPVSPPTCKTRCRISIADLHIRSSTTSSDTA